MPKTPSTSSLRGSLLPGPVTRNGPRHGAVLAVFARALIFAACTAACAPLPRAPAPDPARSLSITDVLAPPRGDPARELRRLPASSDSMAVRLRRAHLLLESGSPGLAARETNRVLFGSLPPSRSEEALAYYLRGRAHAARGDRERAAYDFEQARQRAIDSRLRELIAAAMPPPRPDPSPSRRARSSGAAPARVLERGAWGARRPRPGRMTAMGPIRRITVHHSGTRTPDEPMAKVAARIRGIQRTHMRDNRWADLAYHFLIDRSGRIWRGRELRWQGAHAGGPIRNRGNVGICLLGNFADGPQGQKPSPAQIESLRRLLTSLAETDHVPVDRIYTHRELRATECPGDRLQREVDRLRRELAGFAAK